MNRELTKLKKIKRRQLHAVDDGFTFIELLIVVTILGILAAWALPFYITASNEARIIAANSAAKNAAMGCVAAILNGNESTYIAPQNVTGICADGANFTSNAAAFGVGTAAVYTVSGTSVVQTTSASM